MGLLDKREPCAICGGKVKGLFPWKIEGQLVCNDCYGNVDLPSGMVNNMTMSQFNAYRAFREENNQLRDRFVTGLKVDFGFLDDKVVFDFTNKLMCLDKNLSKTIFEGKHIRSFTIREDAYNLYEGSAAGLVCYSSSVPDRVMALTPQINQIRMQEQMRRNLERMTDNNNTPSYCSTYDIPEPFDKFMVEIQLDHPYWRTLSLDMNGPRFNNTYPDVNDYMRSYQENANTMQQLAQALMDVAFPGAPVQNMGYGMGMGAQAMYGAAAMGGQAMNRSMPMGGAPAMNVDAISEIQRFKALMDQGILTEEEFEAKKRQLLGI